MDHVNQLREGYQKELTNLTNRQTALTQELQRLTAAIHQYNGALAALADVQAGPKPTAPTTPSQPATPVSSAPETSPEATPAADQAPTTPTPAT